MVHVPPPPEPADRFAFTPVAPRPRRDGWTAAAQAAFIAALVAGESVSAACRSVGRSRNSAYALRRQPDAASFAAAWDAAEAEAVAVATHFALDRCLSPTERPVLYRGRIVGQRVVHNDRLMMQILRRAAARELPADPYAAFERAQRQLYNFNMTASGERFD